LLLSVGGQSELTPPALPWNMKTLPQAGKDYATLFGLLSVKCFSFSAAKMVPRMLLT
jgi:hypothetical protein